MRCVVASTLPSAPNAVRGSDAGHSAATIVRDGADGYCNSLLGETTGCFSGPVVFESAEAALGTRVVPVRSATVLLCNALRSRLSATTLPRYVMELCSDWRARLSDVCHRVAGRKAASISMLHDSWCGHCMSHSCTPRLFLAQTPVCGRFDSCCAEPAERVVAPGLRVGQSGRRFAGSRLGVPRLPSHLYDHRCLTVY